MKKLKVVRLLIAMKLLRKPAIELASMMLRELPGGFYDVV